MVGSAAFPQEHKTVFTVLASREMGELHYATTHRILFPKYRKHRASGQAVVTLNGRDIYLGPHGTKASKANTIA